MYEKTFYEVATVLGIAAVAGAVGMALRQPLIVSFLATGIVAGPSGLAIIQSHGQMELLAQIGIALLLFVVGLKLDLHLIRTTGPVALATGLGQVIFTSIFGFLITYFMGFSFVPALYIAVALTFSSTIIIVKLLSDKKEIDALHGRIAVGFLIVQDIAAILSIILLTALGGESSGGYGTVVRMAAIAGKGVGFLILIGLLMRYVLPGLTRRLAGNQEFLLVFSITWAVFLAALGDYLGFSKEVGAFLAGISLASTQYRETIGARLVSVRDFLLLFFFIHLGAQLDLTTVWPQVGNAVWLSLFVLIGNPLIVMAIMGFMGYRRRTGFLAGLAVAQISEFSLIVAALGLGLGHIAKEALSLITLVGVITICLSTYMIIYSGTLYRWLAGPMKIFERKHPTREQEGGETCTTSGVDMIIIGLGRYGSGIAGHLLDRRKRIAAVDFDPQALDEWRSRGVPTIFGDVGDPEFLDNLPLNCARWIVSTVRDRDLTLTLLHLLRERRFEGRTAVAARDEDEAQLFLSSGAHVVLRPYSDASEEAVDSLTEAMHLLPAEIDWPLALKEVRLRKGSVFAGQLIQDLGLRAVTGISILAVSRAGRVYLDPDPAFQLFPADRLVLMGEPSTLRHAEEFLQQTDEPEAEEESGGIATAEIDVWPSCAHCEESLAELDFRKTYKLTVIGIVRGEQYIAMPRADERLRGGDRLIVIGAREQVESMRGSGLFSDPLP
jgi:Kef-type K+ transport system membrane component KefB/Trk K+ transport system NAD-binding subunit